MARVVAGFVTHTVEHTSLVYTSTELFKHSARDQSMEYVCTRLIFQDLFRFLMLSTWRFKRTHRQDWVCKVPEKIIPLVNLVNVV